MCGRGCLGRWGPNHAADPIVTRSVCRRIRHGNLLYFGWRLKEPVVARFSVYIIIIILFIYRAQNYVQRFYALLMLYNDTYIMT